MKKQTKTEMLMDLLYPAVSELGYEPVDLTFEKAGQDWVLTLYIDKEGGVTLDDCQAASHRASDLLDEADPIEQSYLLEVSSPGIDRPLKTERDYLKQIDKRINVNLYAPIDKCKKFVGVLKAYDGKTITLLLDAGETMEFDTSSVAKAAPEIEF